MTFGIGEIFWSEVKLFEEGGFDELLDRGGCFVTEGGEAGAFEIKG